MKNCVILCIWTSGLPVQQKSSGVTRIGEHIHETKEKKGDYILHVIEMGSSDSLNIFMDTSLEKEYLYRVKRFLN